MSLTREEFLEVIKGYENQPFKITCNGKISPPVKYDRALSNSVVVLSNGKPVTYKYDDIDITFDLDGEAEANDVSVSKPLSEKNDVPLVKSKLSTYIDEAKRIIRVHDFSLVDNEEKIKTAIRGTILEKEWLRSQNMIKDAKKNHVLSEKIKTVISRFEHLPESYVCVEYYLIFGDLLALDNDYANASLQFEIAGDYQNAAYYAAQCGIDSDKYLIEIFRKWIMSEKEYNKYVIASFMSLCYSMHYGRKCAETIAKIKYQDTPLDIQKIIKQGLILNLSNYILDESEGISLINDSIQNLLDRLLKESASEQYEPDKIEKIKHADQIKDPFNGARAWKEKVQSGYIIKAFSTYGFVGKEKGDARGVYFQSKDIASKEMVNILSSRPQAIVDLKVVYKLHKGCSPDKDRAVNIEPAEDLDEFLQKKGINITFKTKVKTSEEKLILNPDAVEEVDEAEVERMIRSKTPSAALQFFATTNRPLHALNVLERSSGSFTYDKYVKHKIQLLQRTRSNDDELISLLKYTISTSTDGAYIAHNLYFLGQVQYRCKLYNDVIVTMTEFFKYERFFKALTQKSDPQFLISIAYYMVRDYSNADTYANKLLKAGAHVEEAKKILARTFATKESIDDNEADYSLQFDSEVALTPYIDKLVDSFSFRLISVRDVPSDFDPSLSECTVEQAQDYIQSLIKYHKRSEQRNNPNAAIAIAKIQKWLLQQSSGEEKEQIEDSLRTYVSTALQIMARNSLQQSGVDIRVNLFYRMQQYKMSIQKTKNKLFNAYVNAHFGEKQMDNLDPAAKMDLGRTNPLLMMSDLLFLMSDMEICEVEDASEQIKKICKILESRTDRNEFITAIHKILDKVNCSYTATDKMYSKIISGSKAFQTWLNNNKKTIRDNAAKEHWEELSDALKNLDKTLLSEYECDYLGQVREITNILIDVDKNTQTAMKQNVLNQSRNQLNELIEKLQEEPTFILYSLFDDVLNIMNTSVRSSLAKVMANKPDIEPVGTLQMNLGLTDSKEFTLPLEFSSKPPSVQARNLKLKIKKVTDGVSFISQLPEAQNVDEGKNYSKSLKFRLDNSSIDQVDITIEVEYSFDTFDTFTDYTNEKRSCSFPYTVTFREVESIPNKYRPYAGKQTVRDESMFFGRETLIRKLYDSISTKNSENRDVLNGGNGVVLYGQRRSGKTSILYHLKEKIIKNMKNTIVVDFGGASKAIDDKENSEGMNEKDIQQSNSVMTLQNMYFTIICEVKEFIRKTDTDIFNKLKEDIRAYENENNEKFFPNSESFENAQNPQMIFNAFLDRFRSVARVDDPINGFRIVIIIDEFTYFNEAIEKKKLPYNFMEKLKGIVSDSFITMVIAGQDNMVEFMERYMNEFSSFQREWVTFLEKDASFKMVTEPIGEERIDPESVEKLYRFTAGSPYLLMLICCKLVDWMNENKIYKLESSLLDDFLADEYMKDYEFKEDLLEPQFKDAGRIEWTEKIKLVLGLIARQNSKKVSPKVIPWTEFDDYATINDDMLKDREVLPNEMHEILERLVKRQVIEKQEGSSNRFRIKIPLCREWILRRGGSKYGNE